MKRARGFSLVELMVAVTLALIVTGGVVSVFIGARSAFQSTSGVAVVSDNGRFALGFLEGAVRNAGNMACGAPIRTIINVNAEATPLYYSPGPGPLLLFQPMSGFEAGGTGSGASYTASTASGVLGNWNPPSGWTSGLDAAFSSLAILPVKNNDILVVRSSSQGAQPAYVTAAAANTLTVNSVPASWAAPQLAVVSDCVKSLIFQISSIAGTTITHASGGAPGNLTSAFPATITFAAGSQVTPFVATAYYIGVGQDGEGALWSANVAPNNTLVAAELVPDIEAMQILYGVDTNGSQTVSQYVTADQVADFTSVMSVQIALLAAGPIGSATKPPAAKTYNLLGTTVTAPIDTRFRQVFNVTIAARNSLP
jgi:type IV pilus assembly protein PilW